MVAKEQCNSLIESMASDLIQFVLSHMVETKWTAAFIEVRASSTNVKDMMEKVRITKADGQIDGLCEITIEYSREYKKLISMGRISHPIWYGFKLKVYPDGRHEIEYNYDPNCINDPSFIDW